GFDDELFADRQALVDDNARPALAAELEPLHDSLAVLDHKGIDTLLIGDQGSLRHHHLLFRSVALETDSHQLSVDEPGGWIWKARAREHSVGAAIDRHVYEIDLPHLVVGGPIGKPKPDFNASDKSQASRRAC